MWIKYIDALCYTIRLLTIPQTLKASTALLQHVRQEAKRLRELQTKKSLLEQDEDGSDSEEQTTDDPPIWLNLTTKKHIVDKNRLKPGKITVPHSINISAHTKPATQKHQPKPETDIKAQRQAVAVSKPQPLKTRLAVSSMISYFGDRILTPEMMRAMIILYVGPYSRPDFTTDHLLCPAVAPESLLTRFPKTYILTGERDPLVDDTVLFAGRLRQAKLRLFQERKDLGLEKSNAEFDEKKYVEVALIPGVSHGFVQFVAVYPEGWKHIFRCGRWIEDLFAAPPTAFESQTSLKGRLGNAIGMAGVSGSGLEINGSVKGGTSGGVTGNGSGRHHRRIGTAESSGDEDRPLEMSSIHSSTGPPPPSLSLPGRKGTPGPGIPAANSSTNANTKPTSIPKPAGLKINLNAKDANGHLRREHIDMLQDRSPEEERRERHHARTKSATSLGSEEDLLKRRMQGLTVGLMGDG